MAGLRPIGTLSGAPWTSKVRRYKKEASVILGMYDPVTLTGTSTADGVALIDRATAGGLMLGSVVGFDPVLSDLSKTGYAAADTGFVYVVDDPDVLFAVEEDGDTTPIPITAVGEFCDLATIGNASAYYVSTAQLDSSNAATGDGMRIMELYQQVGNAVMASTASTKAVWVCMINEHCYRAVQTPT